MKEKYDSEISNLNKIEFARLFDSIASVLCANSQIESLDDTVKFANDFCVEASKAGGPCRYIGIEVFSKITNIPKQAIIAELEKYK